MKKIMHIVQAPGGVERYLQMFLKNASRTDYEHIMVCSLDYEKKQYENYVKTFESVEMSREINFRSDMKAIIEVRKLIKKHQPDIIYCHSSKAGAVGRIADLGIKNKVLYNPHGWAFNMKCSSKKKSVYRMIEKLLAVFTDKIIAISEYEKQSAIENHICKPEKMQVIYNGIDIAEYDQKAASYTLTRKDINVPEDAYVIGYVGRLTPQKSPDTYIKAAKEIKKVIPNAYFLMVGTGELQTEIIELAEQLGLKDDVQVTGWVEDPMPYIKLFDQAMLLSRWEGFGLVLAEYMWAEKPIVATKVDAIPNLIKDEENGLLVEKDDVQAIAKAVVKIYMDGDLARKLVETGKRVVCSRYDVNRVVREHEKVFIEIG